MFLDSSNLGYSDPSDVYINAILGLNSLYQIDESRVSAT